MTTLANRLKILRKAKQLNQEDLANLIGATRRQISTYEQGVSSPPLETLVQIANTLDTTTDYLLGISDIPTRDPQNMSSRTPTQQELLDIIESRDEDFQQRLLTLIHILDEWH